MSKLAAQLPRHLHKTTQDPKLTKTTFKAIISSCLVGFTVMFLDTGTTNTLL